MYSKRIVISIIVIGCLVHFITSQKTGDGKKSNSKSPSKPPVKAAPQGKPSTNSGAAKPRGLQQNNKADPKGSTNGNSPAKSPAGKPNMKPPAADKKIEPANNAAADNPDGDEEPAEEKPVGRVKRVLKRITNFTRKMCPFRFFGRLIKRGFGSKKPKPTDDEEVNPDKK